MGDRPLHTDEEDREEEAQRLERSPWLWSRHDPAHQLKAPRWLQWAPVVIVMVALVTASWWIPQLQALKEQTPPGQDAAIFVLQRGWSWLMGSIAG
jgi:hypothetical protein